MMGGSWSRRPGAGLASTKMPVVRENPTGFRPSTPEHRCHEFRWAWLCGAAVLAIVLALTLWAAVNYPWAVRVVAAAILALVLLWLWAAPAMAATPIGRAVVFANLVRNGVRAYADRFPARRCPTQGQEFFAVACMTRDDMGRLDAARQFGPPPAVY